MKATVGADCYVIRISFNSLNHWLNGAKENTVEGTIFVVCGNKIDLKENIEVTREEAEKFCSEKKYEYFEVSAKEGTNINSLLYTSVASLPIFNALNVEGISKENLVETLLQENLDSFRYQNNTTSTNDNGNNTNNTNNNDNQGNLTYINGNNDAVNKSGLLNQKKKKGICSC